jgi:hypothetical protein
MEVKEIFKVDGGQGRILSVHVSEAELREIVQVGLTDLVVRGYITYKSISVESVPEGITTQ